MSEMRSFRSLNHVTVSFVTCPGTKNSELLMYKLGLILKNKNYGVYARGGMKGGEKRAGRTLFS
jgi:hypothetical protein